MLGAVIHQRKSCCPSLLKGTGLLKAVNRPIRAGERRGGVCGSVNADGTQGLLGAVTGTTQSSRAENGEPSSQNLGPRPTAVRPWLSDVAAVTGAPSAQRGCENWGKRTRWWPLARAPCVFWTAMGKPSHGPVFVAVVGQGG